MTDKQIINSCEFQSRCIQYKDMYSNKHIKCPIVDFAIACRGENKCKYKTVYKQLKRKEQECEELTSKCSQLEESFKETADRLLKIQYDLADHCNKYSKTLAEIKEIVEKQVKRTPDGETFARPEIKQILQKISEVENDNK